MYFRRFGGLALAAALTVGVPTSALMAQSTTQDMKNAGTDSKDAAKSVGKGVKKGTKKTYHKTKHGTKKVLDKIDGKPDNATTNPSH